jgi:predicted DNA-binding transcriptional regulator YafY
LLEIEMKVDKFNAPYILTKPVHSSQRLIEKHADGSITLYLRVHHNFEIERLILGFGESIEILKPLKLRNRIKSKLQWALNNYIN